MKSQEIRRKKIFVAMSPKNKTVFVAMSGGVDSSVAAALLKKQGYDVTGVFMKPHQPKAGISNFQFPISKQIQNSKFKIQNLSFCLWQRDREDAMRVAAKLDIPLLTWDFSKEYKKEVTDYMIREYQAGRTPNPDVMCNKHIKFGLFLNKALKEGADYIATGHYVRIIQNVRNVRNDGNGQFQQAKRSNKQNDPTFKLFIARDKNKDQSYFLWTLTQEQLKYCLFPIGDYVKPEVRKMAQKFGLPTADKKDSQGVCFIGPLDMKEFLKHYIKPKKGKILESEPVESTGSGRPNYKIIGSHDGVFYYTIGQRHGLDIKNGKGPYFVVKKDIKKNIIYVGEEDNLKGKTAKIVDINWINNITPHFPIYNGHHQWIEVEVKIRYRSKSIKAVLFKNGDLKFKKTARAITPGQSAVFYRGNELLGGGIIR